MSNGLDKLNMLKITKTPAKPAIDQSVYVPNQKISSISEGGKGTQLGSRRATLYGHAEYPEL